MRWGASILAALLISLSVLAAPVAAKDGLTGELQPGAMRALAAQALRDGFAQQAYALAEALLGRDSEDYAALLIRARAARALDKMDQAANDAAKAWAIAANEEERYAAALTRAQIDASRGRRTISQYWLRRAIDIAPDEVSKATAVRDFRYVRSRSPLSVNLRFSVAPNSNINNGSRSETGRYEIGPLGVIDASLSGAARALSGVEIRGGGTFSYRLSESAVGKTHATLTLDYVTYVMSDSAKKQAPDMQGRDFAFGSAEMGVTRTGRLGSAKRPFRLNATLGKTWYGGDAYMQYGVFGLRQSFVVGDGKRIDADLSRRWQRAISTRTTDADIWDTGLAYNTSFGAGNALRFGLTHRISASDSANLDYDKTVLSGDVVFAKPILGARLEMGVSVGRKHHDRSPVSGEDRVENEYSLRATAVLNNMERFGFVPTVSVTQSRTESNFDQYDSNSFGLKLGLRSAF